MSLTETIRSQLNTAMKERNETQKSILRVILGDLSTLESRSGKKSSDEDVKRVVKKLIEGNTETLHYLSAQESQFAVLNEENNILSSFLPKTLSKEQIKAELFKQRTLTEIRGAKNDGHAIGLAMKYFRQSEIEVDGNIVAAVVKEARNDL